MGATAAKHIAAIDAITELVLADRHEQDAAGTAQHINGASANITSVGADILDDAAIRALLRDADLVVNCAGPFFKLGLPALHAAIDTRTHYLDICDDPGPTAAMFALDGRAREAGVTAVIGMGASPGLSNLLAVRAARELDSVEDCYTAWPLDIPVPGETRPISETGAGEGIPAAAIHLMEQIHGEVSVVEAGQLVQRRPLEPVTLEYPGGRTGAGYVVGHPEPLTLAQSLRLTGRCANLMLLSSGTTAAYLQGLREDLDAGRIGLEASAAAFLQPTEERGMAAAEAGRGLPGPGQLPLFFALAAGTRNGDAATVACHLTAFPRGMDGATSIPAALAVRQLLETMPAPGVHAPERVVDADRLLRELLPHCRPPVTDIGELAPVEFAAP